MTKLLYILTGTPGSGKTTLLRSLELKGYPVIEEAATDLIALEQALGEASPWLFPTFIDKVTNLQNQRLQLALAHNHKLHFFDRSPICTYALCQLLGYAHTPLLIETIEAMHHHYQNQVFFVENLGYIKKTEARQIELNESLKFEQLHLAAYKQFGFELIPIKAQPIAERTENILSHIHEN